MKEQKKTNAQRVNSRIVRKSLEIGRLKRDQNYRKVKKYLHEYFNQIKGKSWIDSYPFLT